MKKNALLLLALAALLGCSKSEHLSDDDVNGLSVQLSSRINDAGVTRGDGVIEGDYPTSTLEVDIFRADMDQPNGTYPTKWEKKIDGYLLTSGDIILAPTEYYLSDATQTSRFIGVYPRGGTYNAADWSVTYSELDGATDVMCSNIAEGYKDIAGNPELTFSHLLTRIEVLLKAQGDNDVVLAEIISFYGKASSIKVADKKTGAKVTLPVPDFSSTPSTAEGAIEFAGVSEDLALKAKDGSALEPVLLTDAAVTFGHAMFLPTDGPDETLELTIEFEDGRTVDVEVPAAQYEASKAYKITVVFEKEQLVSAELTGILDEWLDSGTNPEIGTSQPETTAPDGLSNAYLVAPEGLVVFPVSRAYTYESDAFTNTLRAGGEYTDGFDTDIVWADAADLFKIHTVLGSGKNALVAVRADSGKEGNAVLAIKKKDTQDIVWSYHIWVTDYNPNNTTLQFTNSESNLTFMDRNLGATAPGLGSGAGKGLFYQWGRKDPFPTTLAPDEAQAVNSFTTVAVSETTGTIEYTIQHPGTFLTNGDSPSDWLSTPDPDLWDLSGKKSYYDPCPSGWRVPVNSTATETDSPWKGFAQTNTVAAWDDGNPGYSWGDNAQYPAAGTRERATGATYNPDGGGYYWSASPNGANASSLLFSSGAVNVVGANSRVNGFSVRCVKE